MFKSKIEPARLFDELKSLTANCPKHLQEIDESGNLKPEIQVWLGHLFALVEASGEIIDAERLRGESSQLLTIRGDRGLFAEREIRTILYRNLAKAELMAPVGVHGAFIPVGGAFDAFGAFAKIFGVVANDVLIVDPYLDEILLTDFLPLVPEKVGIRLLADLAGVKPSFAPAVSRWLAAVGEPDRPSLCCHRSSGD